jgi:hypothetical protein
MDIAEIKSHRPKLAVLMCVYEKDVAEWFRSALTSLFGQTYGFQNMHIYLGVNGPIGKDLEEVIEWAGPRIHKVVRSGANLKLSGMLNEIIRSLDEEEYVARMDSDDLCDPSRFLKQVDFLGSRPDVDILGTNIVEIDQKGVITGARKFFSRHEDILRNMYKSTAVGHATICFRTTVLPALGFYDETVNTAEDIDLWFRAAQKGLKFSNLQEGLYSQRFHGANLANRSYQKAVSEFKVYWTGCRGIYGYSPKLLYPLLRFLTRLIPARLVGPLYKGPLRKILFPGG